jgi:hypothetical protein
MTVRELSERMDSQELTEWIAYTKFYEALPDPWRQTGLLASSVLAPYCPKGKVPKSEDFIPLEKPPQHQDQVIAVIEQLRRELGVQ